jgi:hypothetical protein
VIKFCKELIAPLNGLLKNRDPAHPYRGAAAATYSTPFARNAALAAGVARNFTNAVAPSRLAGAADGAAA